MADFEQSGVESMILRIFRRIRPFYRQLHAYVRRRLMGVYRNHGLDSRGPIPAHLLGILLTVLYRVPVTGS